MQARKKAQRQKHTREAPHGKKPLFVAAYFRKDYRQRHDKYTYAGDDRVLGRYSQCLFDYKKFRYHCRVYQKPRRYGTVSQHIELLKEERIEIQRDDYVELPEKIGFGDRQLSYLISIVISSSLDT